jgi:hypothetical protein
MPSLPGHWFLHDFNGHLPRMRDDVRYECRDGTHRMWINPILRLKDGAALADPIEMGEQVEGQFACLF